VRGRFAPLLLVLGVLALVPFLVTGNIALNVLKVALMLALAGTGWNLLGGYGGPFSFGHAVFFGTGAHAAAVLEVKFGFNAWAAFCAGIGLGAALGVAVLRVKLLAITLSGGITASASCSSAWC